MKRDWNKLEENYHAIFTFNKLSEYIHEWAKEKGFWDVEHRNDSEMIMLMVTELSEAVEALRYGNYPSETLHAKYKVPPDFISQVEEELADCVIRIMDYCAFKNFNLGKAIIEKMKYNETREYKHGKEF